MMSAALAAKQTRNKPSPGTLEAWLCASNNLVTSIAARRRASRTTRAPRIVSPAPIEIEREPAGCEVRAGLDRQPAAGLDRHTRESQQSVGQRQRAQHDCPRGAIQPELPEPGFGGRGSQPQERQRPEPARREIQVRRDDEAAAPSEAARPAPPPGSGTTR